MKKWFVVALIACLSAAVVTADEGEGKKKGKGGGKDWDIERFCQMQEKRAEKTGKPYDRAEAEAKFAKKDKNGDGILTPEERQGGGKGKKQKKAE
jgi:hypothetical protein